MLLIKGLEKKFGDFSLSLDLSVGAGETLALVGPSGSGKTSALNLIAGLARPEAGKVFIDGKDITGLPPWKRNIAVVFQDLALFPHLDVGGNIAYGLSLRKVPREERVRVVKETLDLVRLPGYGKRRIHTLSGGERQRVAIARALASSPNALLLDEPFSSLDAPLRKSLRRDFLEIRSRSPVPCVFVTHDQEEALALGDKIALMEGGRIVESGPGRDLLLAPRTENAARFFGAGHVLPCRVTGKNETGAEVSSPLGNLNVTASGTNPPSSVLFIPRDALIYGEPDEKGKWKPAGAVFSLSLYEGLGLTMKLLLSSRENGFTPDEAASGTNENFSLEINTGPRTKAPPAGSPVKLWVNEALVRFVKPDKIGHY